MKTELLQKYEGVAVRATLTTGRVLKGKLVRTGEYTFQIGEEEFLAGSVTMISRVDND